MSNTLTVPYFRPNISEDAIAEVAECIRSGWLTTGPRVNEFEAKFAKAVGAKYAIALNSCTAALHLALEAMGLQRDELVLVPTLTFAASAEVIRYFDAVPVFVDCDDSFNIDPNELERTIKTIHAEKPVAGLKPPYGTVKAVIPVHYGGYSCQMNTITDIAQMYDIEVIEDCAHSFTAYYQSDQENTLLHTGKFGSVGCFSFYANKCITTGEGGMAITDSEELAERIRMMSLHGMSRDAWNRFTTKGFWYYEIIAPGFKYNMTDVAAAIGLHQLKRAEEFRQLRRSIAERYTEAFMHMPAITIPPDDTQNRIHSWHLYSIRLNLERLSIDRAEFIDQLKQRRITCSVHWMPLHLNPYYVKTYGLGEGTFPTAERIWMRQVSLPIFPAMTDEEVDYVIKVVSEVILMFSR